MGRAMIRQAAWALAVLIAALADQADARAPGGNVGRLVDAATTAFLRDHPQAAGVSIGVYQGGRVYRFNYGAVERGGATPPSSKTLYAIASLTKTFTGALLAQAALEGKVRLDDDVRKYLDGDYPNLAFEGQPIRMFDLLDHRSGLPFLLPDRPELMPDYQGRATPWTRRVSEGEAGYTKQDFLNDLHKVKLDRKPGEAASYSNAAATLAGFILERVYGEPYEDLLKRKLLGPLGMTDTSITQTRAQWARTARGYDGSGAVMPPAPVALQAAGGLKSDVDDLLAYVAWGVQEKDPAARLSHQPVVTVPTPEGLKYPYAAGLNWQELLAPQARMIWQVGGLDGYESYCILEPELKLGLVVLFNEQDPEAQKGHRALVDAILTGLDPQAVTLP